MAKTEALDPELSEIGWRRFKFSCCKGYSPKIYIKGLDILINKEPSNFRPHRLRPILLFGIEENILNKLLGWYAMNQ